jgi:hypothetical protein
VPPEDFFDEDWEEPSRTQETAVNRPQERRAPAAQRVREAASEGVRRARGPRRPAGSRPPGGAGPRGPRRPAGGPEWARLAVLGGAVLVVLVIGYLVARSLFGGESAREKNEQYFADVAAALRASDAASEEFHAIFSAQPMRARQLRARLDRAHAEADDALQRARGLTPTTEVEPYQQALELALGYREAGLRCLRDNVAAAYARRTAARVGAPLVPCTQRLLASDVVYEDSFSGPASAALTGADIEVQVPTSRFLQPNEAGLATPRGIGVQVHRLKPRVAARGLHGTSLDSVTVTPGNDTLEAGPDELNPVTVGDDLAFVVSVTNSGNFPEAQVTVRLTLQGGVEKEQRIAEIAPDETVSVTFRDVFSAENQPEFSEPTELTVRVLPVLGERRTTNNVARYTITPQLAPS